MINIEISNCNNISSANINVKKGYLNICYAMNGTGKSTIAKAIDLLSKKEELSTLQSFDHTNTPSGEINGDLGKVLLFNEDFVNTIVFNESEVIQNAFDIFIKSPEYDERQKSINEKLKQIHVDLSSDEELNNLIKVGKTVLSKFSLTNSNELKQVGLIKSLTNAGSIFKLPDQINKFKPLMDKEYNVDWVGWKNDGAKFDDNDICPFCTSTLDENYTNEKEIFASSYKSSNVRNIKEMLSYLDAVKDYMNEEKRDNLYRCIKETEDEQTKNHWIKHFYIDLKFLVDKITMVIEFNTFNIKSEDITRLDSQLRNLIIDPSSLFILNNERVNAIIDSINQKINHTLDETDALKKDIGQLKGLIDSATDEAVKDINEFLLMAEINYKLEIKHEAENTTRTTLRYIIKENDSVIVEDIKLHLSWGERNAFALVLFMHYALSQNPDLIILDDPISSFDSNKKYAIINRLFINKSKKKSFYKKSVLMLTHDLQPVIDFVINNKPSGDFVTSFFMQNHSGEIITNEITENDIKSLPILLAENAKNPELNKIHRIISLRKLLEHIRNNHPQFIAYNLLSCLIHGKEEPTYFNCTKIDGHDIESGEIQIREYIQDFIYKEYKDKAFTNENLITLFKEEQNSYFRLQVFRVLLEIMQLKSKMHDDALIKYIDEQFHIENDYIFSLDYNKYDIVPDFVIPKCIHFLKQEHIL